MKKPFMIASVLVLLTLFTISLTVQEEFYKSKLDDYWHQINRAVCGVVITKDGKLVYENYIGFSSIKVKTRSNNLTNFRMGSILVFEIIFELKIGVFIIKEATGRNLGDLSWRRSCLSLVIDVSLS